MMKVVQGTFRQIPYWKLRGRFHSCGYRDQEVAEHSGIGRYTMSARMNGHQPWTSKEIVAICELLDIRQDEIGELFFPTVEKGESALERLVRMMAMLWAQEIMSAETMEEAKALYERCPRLLKEKVKAILIKSGFEEITQ